MNITPSYKLYIVLFVFSIIFFGKTNSTFSQPDLPNPPTTLQNIPTGSLVIPMDTISQNIGTPFNLKAYGLVHALLMNDIPVKWIIRAGKIKDAIDFTAQVQRIYPSAITTASVNFYASAFVVDSMYINKPFHPWGQTATQVITAFANNVAVYQLMQDALLDVRYTLNQRPKIAVFSNGGNQGIHQTILDNAGVTNYYIINAGAFAGITQCFTFCSEPHWAGAIGDTTITYVIRDFVQNGGNFYAQCRGVETYEKLNLYHTDSSITILNANITNLYYNDDMAYMQIHGAMKENQGGSERNWVLAPTSSWDPGFYHCISGTNKDTVVASAAHLIHPDSVGGNVFYLGGHDYSPFNDIFQINAARLYLNASLVPSGRPTPFTVDVGLDTTICAGQSITLGGSPTAPNGTTYIWTPSATLNNNTASNPIATPIDTTTYILMADNGGCTAQGGLTVNIAPPPTVNAGLDQIICASSPTITLNGSITNASGGIWTGNGGVFSPNATSLSVSYTLSAAEISAGVTQLILSSTGACMTITDTINVTIVPILSVNAGLDQTICFGSTSAPITAVTTGGTAPYTYIWSENSTTSTISVGAGTYFVSVTDASVCPEVIDTVIITAITTPTSANAGLDQISCIANLPITLSGIVTGVTTGGWFGGLGTFLPDTTALSVSYMPSAAEISAGTATLYLSTTGVGLCTPATDTITITLVDYTAITNLSVTNIPCGGNQTAISFTGGAPPFSTVWNTTPLQTGNVISNTDTGSYTVVVTDVNGCTKTMPFSITQVPILADTIYVTTNYNGEDVSCFGVSDGAVLTTVTGGTTPYSYLWSNGATTIANTGIAFGTYVITITDAVNCTKIDTVLVTEPSLVTSVITDSTLIRCNGLSNGFAQVSVTGGVSPYTYNWSAGGTTTNPTNTNLVAGTYIVSVSDLNNCSTIASTTLTQPDSLIVASLLQNNISCFGGSDGFISLQTLGGTTPYSYLWNNAATTASVSGLTTATYSVTVSDSLGCIDSLTLLLTAPPKLEATTANISITCNAENNGQASISLSGGTTPYNYVWSNSQNTPTISGITAATYSVTVIDNNTCSLDTSIIIIEPPILAVTIIKTDVVCFGGNDGTATAIATGGVSNYSYQWDINAYYQNTFTATGLPIGNYVVSITDANNCTTSSSISITEPSPILVLVTPSSDTICVGEISPIGVLASGGSGGYNYAWSQSLGNNSVQNVSPNSTTIYLVTVTDSLGCVASNIGVVTVYVRELTDSINVIADKNICVGDSTSITGINFGQIPPYFYTWNNGLSNNLGSHSVKPIQPTTYILTVSDQCGNMVVDSVTVDVYPLPPVAVRLLNYEGCVPLTVNFTTDSISPTITSNYWDFGNGITSTSIAPTYTYSIPGTYSVYLEVTSTDGCVNKNATAALVNVYAPPVAEMSITPKITDIRSPNVTFSSLSQNIVNQFWTFGDGDTSTQQTLVHTYPDTGKYPINYVVINQYGCTDTLVDLVVVLPFHTFEVPNAFTPNSSGPNGGVYDINNLTNEVFFPFTNYVKDYHMMIFNRWGELIFESFDLAIGWDGYYRGELSQQDVYVWKIDIKYVDDVSLSKAGDVTLVR